MPGVIETNDLRVSLPLPLPLRTRQEIEACNDRKAFEAEKNPQPKDEGKNAAKRENGKTGR